MDKQSCFFTFGAKWDGFYISCCCCLFFRWYWGQPWTSSLSAGLALCTISFHFSIHFCFWKDHNSEYNNLALMMMMACFLLLASLSSKEVYCILAHRDQLMDQTYFSRKLFSGSKIIINLWNSSFPTSQARKQHKAKTQPMYLSWSFRNQLKAQLLLFTALVLILFFFSAISSTYDITCFVDLRKYEVE